MIEEQLAIEREIKVAKMRSTKVIKQYAVYWTHSVTATNYKCSFETFGSLMDAQKKFDAQR